MLWDTREVPGVIAETGAERQQISFHPKDDVFSVIGDQAVSLWDARTGLRLFEIIGHGKQFHQAEFSPDRKWLATASRDKTARIWDVSTGRLMFVLEDPESDQSGVWSTAFNSDSSRIATTGGKTVNIWDVATGKRVGHIKAPSGTGFVWSVAFTTDGQHPVSDWDDGIVRTFDTQTGAEVVAVKGNGTNPREIIYSGSLSHDGTRLLTGGVYGAHLWNEADGKLVADLPGGGTVGFAFFNPDHRTIFVSSQNDDARIFDARTGNQIAKLGTKDYLLIHQHQSHLRHTNQGLSSAI